MRSVLRLLPLVVLPFLAVCDDPADPVDDESPIELPPPTGPISAVITTAGGSLSATTDEGVVVTLNVPPGAVRADTEVTVRPVAPDGSGWFGVLLEPAGLRLLEPVALEIVLPEGIEVAEPMLFLGAGDDALPVATEWDAATRTLSTDVLALFGLESSAALAPVPAPDPARGARRAGASNKLSGGSATCSRITSSAESTLDDFTKEGKFDDALAAVLAIGALLQQQRCPTDTFLTQAQQSACDGAQAAFDRLANEPTTNYAEFTEQTHEILGWTGVLFRLTADCGPANAWSGEIEREIDEFLDFYQEKLDGMDADDYPTFLDLKEEALTLIQLRADAGLIGLDDAEQKILTDAYQPTLDRMRETAYSICRDSTWALPQFALSRLTRMGFFAGRDVIGLDPPRPGTYPPTELDANFDDPDVFEDIQYCGTEVDVHALGVADDTLGTMTAGTEGTPGSHVSEVTIETSTRGAIHLAGDLRALTCWNEVEADTIVELSLNGSVVYSLARTDDAYLPDEGLTLTVAELADSADITPQEGVSHDLVFERRRDACLEPLWGEPTFELFTVTLDWVNPTLTVEIEFPDTVAPGAENEAAVRVAVIDQAGDTAYFPDIDVTLVVTGGEAAPLSGRTDSTGWFRTTVTADENAASFSIRANASSFEGATASATHDAVLRGGRLEFRNAFYRANAVAWVSFPVGSTQDEMTQQDEGILSFQGSTSASVTHDSVGTAGSDASISALTADGAEGITQIAATGQLAIIKATTRSTAVAEGSGSMSVRFEVVGGPATVRVTANVTATPQNYGSDVDGEAAQARVTLDLIQPEPYRVLEALIDVDSWDGDPPADIVLTLEPGHYSFGAAVSGSSGPCDVCEVSADSQLEAQLMVQ